MQFLRYKTELLGSHVIRELPHQMDGKVCPGIICVQNISLKSLLSSGEDLLASLIGFLEIRLIFKKHPIPSGSQGGSGGLRPY